MRFGRFLLISPYIEAIPLAYGALHNFDASFRKERGEDVAVGPGGEVLAPVHARADRPLLAERGDIALPSGQKIVSILLFEDLLIVPLLACDRECWRLGYGGGFFDRTLAALQPRPVTVGLAYAHGYIPWLEAEPHDVPLDAILTEDGEFVYFGPYMQYMSGVTDTQVKWTLENRSDNPGIRDGVWHSSHCSSPRRPRPVFSRHHGSSESSTTTSSVGGGSLRRSHSSLCSQSHSVVLNRVDSVSQRSSAL